MFCNYYISFIFSIFHTFSDVYMSLFKVIYKFYQDLYNNFVN